MTQENTPISHIQTENSSWRQRQHVLYGTANEEIQSGSFSADVDLVAYNVAKTITAADLGNWLSQRGLFIKHCKLLTTSDEARSLSFKVTIDPKDFDRATKDANLWPYRVGVRLYKNFSTNIRDKYNNNKTEEKTSEIRNEYHRGSENRSQRNNQVFPERDGNYRRYGNNSYQYN